MSVGIKGILFAHSTSRSCDVAILQGCDLALPEIACLCSTVHFRATMLQSVHLQAFCRVTGQFRDGYFCAAIVR